MTTLVDARPAFPEFYSNPAIRALEGASRWTVSGRLGDDTESKGKAPIDLRELLDNGRVRGAWARDAQCLVTLDELTRRLPDAANAAFYLQAQTDGFVVIDIEPACPPSIATDLLRLPGIMYSELSMSGRGYHLVAALPDNFYRHSVASGKRVLREEHGWYEILLDHWVTFTRQPIGKDVWARVNDTDLESATFSSVEDLYASLAANAKASSSASATAVRTHEEAPEIKGGKQIVTRTLEGALPRLKVIDDFDGDHSRWEFSILGTLFREMRKHLVRVGFVHRTTYSAGDQAWLLFQAAVDVIPARAKHNERRNDRPFLLDRAAAMVAANCSDTNGEAA